MFSSELITIHDLIEVIIKVLDARDPYTFAHSWRVAEISEHIARNMPIEDNWVERIHIAAHLHDIGKIGVPDAILNKKGKLTPAEYETVKSHSIIGHGIISRIPILDDISLYVRHHHERFDGGGYPDGLAGRDIPLGARIIAVADTFDAITSHRHYRRAASYDEAFRIIQAGAGTQLCPECAECFLDMKERVPEILRKVNREIAEGPEKDKRLLTALSPAS